MISSAFNVDNDFKLRLILNYTAINYCMQYDTKVLLIIFTCPGNAEKG